MNFFRKALAKVTRRQIIADMYDENAVINQQPAAEMPPVDVVNVAPPQQPVENKAPYSRNKNRREELNRLKSKNENKGFTQDVGYLGYSSQEYNTVLPLMKDGIKPYFTPGQMTGIDLLDRYEIDPEFQSTFPQEWVESDYWLPLLAEAIKQVEEEGMGQQATPSIVDPGSVNEIRQPEQVAIWDEQQMNSFIATKDPSAPLPEEIANVPANLAAYLEMSKVQEVQFISELSSREEQMKMEELSTLRGVPPTELAASVFDNLIKDNIDRMEMLSGDNRFSDQIDAWPLDLSEYVFKGVDGGVGKNGEKDFRIRFFLDGGSEFAPAEVKQWMEEEDGRNNPEKWENYRDLYNNHIEQLSEQIQNIADPSIPFFNEYGEQDDDMKIRAEETLWNYIVRKLQSKTMRKRKTEFQESDGPGNEDGSTSLSEQIEATPQKADASKLSEEDREKYMSSLFGDFSSMADQIHDLAKDARDYLFDKYGREEMVASKSGKQVSNAPFYAALTIDALGELGAEAMRGWQELSESGQLTPAELDKLSKGKQISRSPKRVSKDATPDELSEIQNKKRLGNLKYDPESQNNWSAINWQGLVPPGLALNRVMDLHSGNLEGSEDDPNSYRNIIPNLENWRGRPLEGMEAGKNEQSNVGYAAQLISTELGDFLIDNAFEKYPKNVILAFLNSTKAFTGVSDFARYTVYSGEVGENARKELLSDSLAHGMVSEEGMASLNHYLDTNGIKQQGMPVEESHIEMMPDNVVYDSVKDRISRIKKEQFKQIPMTMWNSVSNIMSLPEDKTVGTPPSKEDREEWNTRRNNDFNIRQRAKRRASAVYEIIKTALSGIEDLRMLKSSMGKFASTDIIDNQIRSISEEARIAIDEVRRTM